jgi:hypothetical protein
VEGESKKKGELETEREGEREGREKETVRKMTELLRGKEKQANSKEKYKSEFVREEAEMDQLVLKVGCY